MIIIKMGMIESINQDTDTSMMGISVAMYIQHVHKVKLKVSSHKNVFIHFINLIICIILLVLSSQRAALHYTALNT